MRCSQSSRSSSTLHSPRTLTQRGNQVISPQLYLIVYPLATFFIFLAFPFFGLRTDPDLPDSLEDISNIAGLPLPSGALNVRLSAHFLEINSIYAAEMEKRVAAA